MDHESVQATALKVVFDLLHVYGFEAFNIGEPGEPASAAKTTNTPEQDVCTVQPNSMCVDNWCDSTISPSTGWATRFDFGLITCR